MACHRAPRVSFRVRCAQQGVLRAKRREPSEWGGGREAPQHTRRHHPPACRRGAFPHGSRSAVPPSQHRGVERHSGTETSNGDARGWRAAPNNVTLSSAPPAPPLPTLARVSPRLPVPARCSYDSPGEEGDHIGMDTSQARCPRQSQQRPGHTRDAARPPSGSSGGCDGSCRPAVRSCSGSSLPTNLLPLPLPATCPPSPARRATCSGQRPTAGRPDPSASPSPPPNTTIPQPHDGPT